MRDKILNYQQLECDYFNLYNQFISVDFQISLFEKNHKSLIKDFIFFYHQILKQKDLNFLLGVRNKIALKVHNYMQEYSTSPKDLSLICLREHKHIEFFQRFYKALAYFVAFRKKLDEEQKIKNLISNIPNTLAVILSILTLTIYKIFKKMISLHCLKNVFNIFILL